MDKKKNRMFGKKDPFDVASSTDCTGLVPSPPQTDAEADAYSELCTFPITKNKKRTDTKHR